MSAKISISLEGADKIRTMLAELEKKAGDLTPAMKSIGEHVVSVARLSFRFEKTPSGIPWPRSERAHRQGGKTLSNKGRLKGSLDNPKAIKATANSVSVSTNVKYAAIHQFGFNGNVSVKPHQRAVTQAFGKKLKYPVWAEVAGFTRKMFMVDRPFLPMTLEEIGIEDVEATILKHLME